MNDSVDAWHDRAMRAALNKRSQDMRKIMVQTMHCAGRGHLASALSLVEILCVLYDKVLRYDSKNPDWPERDRCILSKGHGCLALYAVLADKGFFPKDELNKFCSAEGILGGHPERGKIPGVEATTGSLGHGPSIGVGLALSARMQGRSSRVFVIIGDGEAQEGSVWEAALCASKHCLDNFIIIIDYNKLQSYGPVSEVSPLEPLSAKWQAFGFEVRDVNGHDPDSLLEVMNELPFCPGKPSVIICHTVKGKGFAGTENNLAWHHKSKVTAECVQELMNSLDKQCAKPV
ncbi:transketolase [Desulfonatronovibrio magnus]|uniref:transketolase n=1 Tax=Desulfonatronovibrio magnus TaxID=698827 RepID=UPI000AC7674F|nr:transketolase [Desulfonatronovibrio magnus]